MPAFPGVVGSAYGDLMTYLSGEESDARAPISRQAATSAISSEDRWRTGYGYVFYSGADRPAVSPPWSTLTAYDLNSGDKLYRITVGHHPGYPIADVQTGLPLTKIGPVVTASGLLFVATSLDRRLTAYDAASGEAIWSAGLPAPALGIPSTYAVGGRQYIVVAAAGGGGRGAHEPDNPEPARNAYVAYALPRSLIQ
jgi:quinoprotein glucose dehydrogenase